jgi:AcrR family transcriptional regulator
MARWQPGTRERLQGAALELFSTRGFEQTTATEIAEAAGVTERTFFRHFSDKREVLFDGQDTLVEVFVAGVEAAPPKATPSELVAAALAGSAGFFTAERKPWSRARQAVIDRNAGLQEREQLKMALLTRTVGATLRARGVEDPVATLAAHSAVAVFATAFGMWLQEERGIEEIQADLLSAMSELF